MQERPSSVLITISYGDEPEKLDTVLENLRECGAAFEVEAIALGADIYRREVAEGILPESFEAIKRSKILLKSFTAAPKDAAYNNVATAICNKLEIHNKMEYYVSDLSPGIGFIKESEQDKINNELIAECFNLSAKLGGNSFGYDIDELALLFEAEQKKQPKIKVKFQARQDLEINIADYDVIFSTEVSANKLIRHIKPKAGCTIYFGNGYLILEAIEEYNKNGKGLLLAAALILKYSGQTNAAWAVYKQI